MASPNATYNHLRGDSKGLSRDNIEAILIMFPEITFEELAGWPGRVLILDDPPE
jgi:hypothetical protein